MKQCATCSEYQYTQPQERSLHYEIPYKLWKVVSVAIFIGNNKALLCIVDCYNYSRFPIVKKVRSLSADDLVQMVYYSMNMDSIKIVSCSHKLHIRDVQGMLQKDEHSIVCNILIPLPEQWSSGSKNNFFFNTQVGNAFILH